MKKFGLIALIVLQLAGMVLMYFREYEAAIIAQLLAMDAMTIMFCAKD